MPTCSATDKSHSSLPLAEEMDTSTCSVAGEGTQLQDVPTIKLVETYTQGMQTHCNEASQSKYLYKIKNKNKGA